MPSSTRTARASIACSRSKGKSPLTREVLAVGINQLKAFVDICHLYGIAVILDVVYNHASGDIEDQPESIYFFDRAPGTNPNDSLYFTDQDHTGPVFAFWNRDVRQFLIDNAGFFLDEYHVDGFRYDQVTVIDQQNAGSGGVLPASDRDAATQDPSPSTSPSTGGRAGRCAPRSDGGAGFDAGWHDGLRTRSPRRHRPGGWRPRRRVDWQPVVDQLRAPGFRDAWRAVQCIESHDEVYRDRGTAHSDAGVGDTNTRTLVRHAAARASRPACFSPLPASRCSSWARSSRGQALGRRPAESPRKR